MQEGGRGGGNLDKRVREGNVIMEAELWIDAITGFKHEKDAGGP